MPQCNGVCSYLLLSFDLLLILASQYPYICVALLLSLGAAFIDEINFIAVWLAHVARNWSDSIVAHLLPRNCGGQKHEWQNFALTVACVCRCVRAGPFPCVYMSPGRFDYLSSCVRPAPAAMKLHYKFNLPLRRLIEPTYWLIQWKFQIIIYVHVNLIKFRCTKLNDNFVASERVWKMAKLLKALRIEKWRFVEILYFCTIEI